MPVGTEGTPSEKGAGKENNGVYGGRSDVDNLLEGRVDVETGRTTTSQCESQLTGDSGLWASMTSGFEVTYISKSHSHAKVPFDFVVMEKKGSESNCLEKASGGSVEQVNRAMDPRVRCLHPSVIWLSQVLPS